MEIEIKGAPIEALSFEEEFKGSKTACCDCGATVGTFTWVGDDRYKCQQCRRGVANPNGARSTFPFTADHIVTGQKIEVQSLRHLRKLEAQHGVQSTAYNMDSKNFER